MEYWGRTRPTSTFINNKDVLSLPVVVMKDLLDVAQHHHSPSPLAVTLFKCTFKLIFFNELPPRNFKNVKRGKGTAEHHSTEPSSFDVYPFLVLPISASHFEIAWKKYSPPHRPTPLLKMKVTFSSRVALKIHDHGARGHAIPIGSKVKSTFILTALPI